MSKKIATGLFPLALLMVAIALWGYGLGNRKPLTIFGIRPGMSRDQVERILGPAFDSDHRGYAEYATRTTVRFGVLYDNGRALRFHNPAMVDSKGQLHLRIPGRAEQIIQPGAVREQVESLSGRPIGVQDGYFQYSSPQAAGVEVNYSQAGKVVVVSGLQLERGNQILVQPHSSEQDLVAALGEGDLSSDNRIYNSLGCVVNIGSDGTGLVTLMPDPEKVYSHPRASKNAP